MVIWPKLSPVGSSNSLLKGSREKVTHFVVVTRKIENHGKGMGRSKNLQPATKALSFGFVVAGVWSRLEEQKEESG
jgi:hypothetical protein